ncbi:MAG: hypothetical protein U1E86_22055 [Burkholderiaceae bacterium]
MPQPVRTAHTETTGRAHAIIVRAGPGSTKSAPAARQRAPTRIRSAWLTSLYANTTRRAPRRAISASSGSCGSIGMPSGYAAPASDAG